jgi:hypothetical protein
MQVSTPGFRIYNHDSCQAPYIFFLQIIRFRAQIWFPYNVHADFLDAGKFNSRQLSHFFFPDS